LPLATAVRARTPLWFESYEELLEQYPQLAAATTPRERIQAVVAMPLIHGGRVIGGFALSFAFPRTFAEGDRRWLESFASQCALAVERARLYDAEREARTEAETLFRISESLKAARLDLEALVQRTTDEGTQLVGANFGAFFYNLVNDAGETYVLYALAGAPKEAFAKFGLPRNTPMFAATFVGEGVIRLADVRKDPRYGQMGPHFGMPRGHLPVVSYLAVPVVSRSGTVLGGLFFGHRDADRFTEQHERMVSVLAASAAAAIDNANLFGASRIAERNQRRLVDELTETVRLNDLLAGVLAHDLRNPLGSILTSAELALRHFEQGDVARLARPLNRIVTSGERMSRLIDQLLDFTRTRVGGGFELTVAQFDLAELVGRVAEELEGASTEAQLELETVGDTSGTWDEDRLAQVFSNLLGNALQHGARDSRVHVRLDGSEPDQVSASIHNMGAIPASVMGTLFVPLAPRDDLREQRDGLGLGLFITREIAEAHGGSVEVQSSDQTGTCFTLRLPRNCTATRPPASTQQGHGDDEAALRPWQTAEHLVDTGQKFRLLVESVEDYAIFMLDPGGRVATWNAGAERIKGYAAREIIGQHFSRFYDDEQASAGICEQELELAAREGRLETEGYRVRKDGSRFWANVVLTALRRPSGELVGFAKVTRDLTERKKLEEERLRRAQVEEALRLRDEFLSVVSHEFKTPLSVLQLQIEALTRQKDALDPALLKNIQRAKRSSDHLLRTVDAILEVTRITSGTFALKRDVFDLAEALSDVVESVRPHAQLAGCELMLEVEAPLIGSWDRRRLEHVVTQLLMNALTYAAGAPIRISLTRRADEAWLEVADSGPGIDSRDLSRIFDRFERATSMRHFSGLGLGLYLAREVVQAHGGNVSAEDTAGRGAHFIMRLPIQPLGDAAR
ncbi:MAG TPA: ATP-binding protein, partial [Polyangiaceae bacterium]|nr:ATP-binding protein [Polyangiaceae bacterium]